MVGANGAAAEEEPPSSQAPKKRSHWVTREEPVDGTSSAAPGGEDVSEVKRQRKSKVGLYAYVFTEPMSEIGAV